MSRRTQRNVGIIGLGIIGQRVAENLRRRGFSVFVWNRTPRPFPNFVGSPTEIAQICDYIQIFVSDDEALLQVVQNLKQSLKAHHVVMAHSTVAPHTMRAAAEIVHRRGAQFLDAPFTGSKNPAEKGELVYYIGGDDAAFKRARPVLEASSKEIIEIGEIGQATLIKIATNIVTAATVQVAAEALALVHSVGLPLEKFVRAMRDNASNSGTLAAKLPKMVEGDFDPHFSVKHMLKDVQIASRLARSYGLTLGATETARDSLLEEVRQERGDYDYSSLIRSYFPDGKPAHAEAETSEPEQHPTLALDERPAESRTREAAFLPEPNEPAKVDAPPSELLKFEAKPNEPPKAEAPAAEQPRFEAPPTELPKEELVPIELPKSEAAPSGPPKEEPAPSELPKFEAPPSEPPKEEFGLSDLPKLETSAAAWLADEALSSEPPKSEAPPSELPKVEPSDESSAIDLVAFDDGHERREANSMEVERLLDLEPVAKKTAPTTDEDPARAEEDLEPAAASERSEKEGARRGFFSRMFGKTTDYEDSDY